MRLAQFAGHDTRRRSPNSPVCDLLRKLYTTTQNDRVVLPCDVGGSEHGSEWLLEEAACTAARSDWRCMGVVSESVAYGFLVASYRRRMGLVAVREMARHRYRQSQFVGLTRLQLDEIGRERQVQRQGAQRAEARAELSVELAQARILPAYELGR